MAKEGRVGLGLWDRLVLFTAWVVTCGLVYVLGFYLGKGTQEQRLGLEERVVRLPVTSKPPPEGQRPRADSGLTFYDTLASGERADEKAPPPVRAPEPAPAPAAAAPARPVSAPAPAPATARPTPPPAPVATPPAPAVRPAAAPIAAPPPPVAAPPASVPGAAAPARPQAAPTDVAAVHPSGPPPGRAWTVQANPTRNRDEADALFRQLRGRGYDASIVRVLRDGDTWYRVQVGRFASSQQAGETMQRLKDREGVQHVFVASE